MSAKAEKESKTKNYNSSTKFDNDIRDLTDINGHTDIDHGVYVLIMYTHLRMRIYSRAISAYTCMLLSPQPPTTPDTTICI